MIFELLRTRRILIVSSLLLIVLITILFIIQAGLPAIGLFTVMYIFMVLYYTKRVGIHELMALKNSLMQEKKVKDYIEIYEKLLATNISKDERWIVTKKHNLALGYIFSGLFDKGTALLEDVEKNQKKVLVVLPVFEYLQQTLNVMFSILKLKEVKYTDKQFKLFNESFEKLDEKSRTNILNNKNSFHNWILWTRNIKLQNKTEMVALNKELNPMINALSVFYLDQRNLKCDDSTEYCNECFKNII